MELDDFKYNLSRLKKCDQFWDEMNPILGGRHCNKCDKKIVDFSNMTFTDISIYMSESKEPVCGFYKPEQLKESKKSKLHLHYVISISAFLTNLTIANAKKSTNQIEIHPTEQSLKSNQNAVVKTSEAFKNIDTIFITGKVQFYDTAKKQNVPILGASIIIKGTKKGTVTNSIGVFTLPILRANYQDSIYLRIASVAFKAREIKVKISEQNQIEIGQILLETEEGLIEFWVMTKKRSKLNKLWRKITKPFRKSKKNASRQHELCKKPNKSGNIF